MELLNVRVRIYKNIKEQRFNFSPDYHIYYDKTKEKSLDYDKNEYGEFKLFGKNISNITAIVGKNGSGKSTLLNAILTNKTNFTAYDIRNMLAYKVRNMPASLEPFIKIIGKDIDGKVKLFNNEDFEKINLIYFDNIIHNKLLSFTKKMINISSSYFNTVLNNYKSEDIKKQILFFESEELKKIKNNLSKYNNGWIKIPEKIKINLNLNLRNNNKQEKLVENLKTLIIKCIITNLEVFLILFNMIFLIIMK